MRHNAPKREHPLSFRLTDKQFDYIKRQAGSRELTVSEWLRGLISAMVRKEEAQSQPNKAA